MICALGDLLLDVVVSGPGRVETAADTYSSITVGPGGQAANVAAWVAALGGKARLVAKTAADPAGELLSRFTEQAHVERLGPVVAADNGRRTGVVVSLSGLGGERTMLTDRGVSPSLAEREVDAQWFSGCEWLHLPMYSLVEAPIRGAALRAARCCRRVSIDLSSVTVLRALGAGEVARLLGELRPEVVFANEDEAALVPLGGAPTTVVKLGAGGVIVNGHRHRAAPASAVDSTGAGDALAAGYLVGGTEAGLSAAAAAVAKVGAWPAA